MREITRPLKYSERDNNLTESVKDTITVIRNPYTVAKRIDKSRAGKWFEFYST